ncbi:hypothetical protein GCM10027296_43690 [Chitinimonas naiadis]
MSFGGRLKQERERLGLSQLDLAEKLGIHRNTVVRYESDKRPITGDTLELLHKAGIDQLYVMTGERRGSDKRVRERVEAIKEALGAPLVHVLGISDDEVMELSREVDKRTEALSDRCEELPSGTVQWQEYLDELATQYRVLCEPLVRNSPRFKEASMTLDTNVMTAIFEGLEAAQAKHGLLAVERRAKVVAMLYRAFISSGKVDPRTIDEAVSLAV